MIVIGLTGSVGMGKSTVGRMFARYGIPVHDADAAVHKHYRKGSAGYRTMAALFPEAAGPEAMDRKRLAKRAFEDPSVLKTLEKVLHPLVRQEEAAFLKDARRTGRQAVILDIPLLFETGGERRCDVVIVVSAPAFLQKRRVMARPGMSEETFAAILRRQMPDAKKRRRADVIIRTGLGKAFSRREVARFVARLRKRSACGGMTRKGEH